MPSEAQELRKRLRRAGVAPGAIKAVWPAWWSDEAESSRSAVVELRYTVARRLGLSPRSLFDDGTPEFLWTDAAKFKNAGMRSEHDLAILTSFSVAVGQNLLSALPDDANRRLPDAAGTLRETLLQAVPVIDLRALLDVCWAIGIPVIQLGLFPLGAKRMHATTVQIGGRHAVLIGRTSRYAAQIAYILAHEFGHIARHHLRDVTALVEADDPIAHRGDDEEQEADEYALELLTGSPTTTVESDRLDFSARQLAQAAAQAAGSYRIDPGILALCLGHSSGRWRQAFGALKLLPPGEVDVGGFVNDIARQQLRWELLSMDEREFLESAMGGESGGT
jgi:hypothetical protein